MSRRDFVAAASDILVALHFDVILGWPSRNFCHMSPLQCTSMGVLFGPKFLLILNNTEDAIKDDESTCGKIWLPHGLCAERHGYRYRDEPGSYCDEPGYHLVM